MFYRALQTMGGVFDPDAERADGRAVHSRERAGETVGLVIDDKVDGALAVKSNVFGTMTRNGDKAQGFE
jgi:hypothetical protein